MAWPSGTKASTANVDEGTDLISNARADIKQNIDNVNDIIDHLNISSPNNGDILQYSSTTGKWEQVTASSIAPTADYASWSLGTGSTLVSGSTYRKSISSTQDIVGDSIFLDPTDSTNDLEVGIAAGTYLIYPFPGKTVGDTAASLSLYDETNATVLLTNFFQPQEIGTTTTAIINGFATFTVATDVNISFRVTSASATARSSAAYGGILQKIS